MIFCSNFLYLYICSLYALSCCYKMQDKASSRNLIITTKSFVVHNEGRMYLCSPHSPETLPQAFNTILSTRVWKFNYSLLNAEFVNCTESLVAIKSLYKSKAFFFFFNGRVKTPIKLFFAVYICCPEEIKEHPSKFPPFVTAIGVGVPTGRFSIGAVMTTQFF